MKTIFAVLFLLISQLAFASHCQKPELLPEEVKEFALAELAVICPNTVNQESMDLYNWSFRSWDTDAIFEMRFKGRGYGTGDVDYDMTVEVTKECVGGNRIPYIEKIKIEAGCR